jgi:predicted 2-oxoglutarate/Fe(II)-dependent dioxygenase YbiX
VRKGVEQHLVLVQERASFYSLVFLLFCLTMIGTLKKKGARCIYYERLHPQRHARTHQHKIHDYLLALVRSAISCFNGNSDPRAYIGWELKVEKEFDEHDLSDAQMIYIASHTLTKYALLE